MSQTKIQNRELKIAAVMSKNPKKSEIRYPDIRIVEDTMSPLVIIHAKY